MQIVVVKCPKALSWLLRAVVKVKEHSHTPNPGNILLEARGCFFACGLRQKSHAEEKGLV